MVCKTCRADMVRLEKTYTRRMMKEGRRFKERHQERVLCPECGKEFAMGSLVEHRQTKNGVAKGGLGKVGNKEGRGNEPRTFNMEFPAKAGPMPCPVEWCTGRAATRTAMRVHL